MQKQHGDLFLSASAMDRLNLYKTIRQLRRSQSSVSERLSARQNGEPLVTEVNLRQIASATGRNYGSIYNIYNDLLVVLQTIVGDPHAELSVLFSVPEADLRLHMIEQTAVYHYLQAALNGNYERFDEFVATEKVSRMTMMRHLRPMREMAATFGVQMQPEALSFAGEERHLRLFVMTMFWHATGGTAWPFTQLDHDSAGRLVDTLYTALDCQPSNPVARELSMYYLAVATWRIKDGHLLNFRHEDNVIDYPLPNLDLALGRGRFKDFVLPPMTRQQLMGETEFGFFLMNFAPVYLVANDEAMTATIDRYRRYAPAVYRLVTNFVQIFPAWSPTLSDDDRQLLMVNLLAVTCSVLTLGEDFNQLVAYTFNHGLQLQGDDPHYERMVRQTLTQVVLSKHLEGYIDWIDVLTHNYYRNLYQLRALFHPQRTLRVALVLEQTSLEYVDLIAMLRQQAFVELLPSADQMLDADLVIQSAALPLELPAGVPVFHWEPNASADHFGELFAVLIALWREKRAGSEAKQRRA
ncbi:helix-turn-helix domain-containing protein [Lacticaseibacillus sp. GG6-2]